MPLPLLSLALKRFCAALDFRFLKFLPERFEVLLSIQCYCVKRVIKRECFRNYNKIWVFTRYLNSPFFNKFKIITSHPKEGTMILDLFLTIYRILSIEQNELNHYPSLKILVNYRPSYTPELPKPAVPR